ncbi:unnamed protein product [Chironomus riparius]|uniref:NACHT domain-containing protein n=1 Tax=Chironomus riparius TaxID=315576 RepID=A0A9N9RRY1_9DIPT|nr:unnamed protein product [Chironomus riparius]
MAENKHKFEVDSVAKALKLLLKTFLSKRSSNDVIQKYYFTIKSQFNEEIKESSFSYYMNKSTPIIVAFKSNVDNNHAFIFWRTSSSGAFKSLNISKDPSYFITDFCLDLLDSEIKNGRDGILKKFEHRKLFDLKHIGNELGQNLLIKAASKCQNEVIENLLAHNFDVDSMDNDGCNAIERAWEFYDKNDDNNKHKTDNVMLTLLHANSKLPRNHYSVSNKVKNIKKIQFEPRLAPRKVKKFVNMCEDLHELADSSEIMEIEKIINEEPNLKYFYDKNNKSLMAHALSNNKIDVCKLLVSLKVSIAHHEVASLNKLYKTLEDDDKLDLQTEHRVHAIELPKLHVYTLLMRSKIGRNDRQHDDRWAYVEDAFRIIDANDTCSKIFKIAAIFQNFTIYFEFENEVIYYLDPMSNSGGLGKIYGDHSVYIGAKNLIDDNRKYEVMGAIIHELCHFAVLITYLNDYNPYPIGESKEKKLFTEAVQECIENREVEEDIVGSVMDYPEYQRDSEFIVRVVQMVMHYYIGDAKNAIRNTEALNERKDKFKKLFKYFEEVVEKDFDELLKIFEKLLDVKQTITFDELTRPFKKRILYSDINFQGQKTNFNDLIGDDDDILKLMTPQQIRGMLVDGRHIPVAQDTNEYFETSDRTFTDYNTDLSLKIKEDIKNSDDIIEEIQESKIFILADTAGAGKTTSFKNLFLKLKENYKNFWVCLIELRKFQHIFEVYNKIHEKELTIEKVLEMIIKMLNFDSSEPSLETKLFEKLFFNDKVIFLFDAVDEISPYFNKFIINVLQKIQESTHNQILVSTRPQHAKQLSESLKAKPFKLVPFSWKEKESFILEMLKDSETYDESKEQEVLNDFNIFFKSIKNIGYFNYDIDNPLMVKIITELYIIGQIDLKNQSLDLYEIFEKIEFSHKKQVDSKVAFEDRDPFSTISLESVHQALALLLLSSSIKTELYQTYIIKSWNENKKGLTDEKIQRYGFVRIGRDFKENDEFALDFTHRTYAEFFVAKFILTFLFKIEDFIKDEELEKVIKVIKIFVNNDTIENIFGFIMCYMKNNAEGRNFILKKLILKEFHEIKNELFFDPNDEQLLFLKFFSVFFIREQAVLNDFWLLNREQNMLRMILIETNILGYFKLQNLIETLSISFGPNWHERFNSSGRKLIKNEEIKEIEGNENFFNKQFNKNLFKFLDYFENNFTNHEKVTICKNGVFVYENVELIEINLMKKMLSIYSELSKKNNQILIDILIAFIKYTANEEILMYLAENIEELLNKNKESIREVLFYDYEREQHPLFKAVKFKNSEIFQKFKTIFKTYQLSNDDLKNIFVKDNNLLYLTLLTPNKMFDQISTFVNEIYGSDYVNLVQSFEPRTDLKVLSLVFEDKRKFNSVKKFILKCYKNNESKTKLVLKHLLTYGHLSFCAPLLPAIRKRNVAQFKSNLEIYNNFGISWKNVTNLNIIINISMELFLNMTKETYEEYKKFLITLYNENKGHIEEPKVFHTFRFLGISPTTKFFLNLSTNLIAKCVYQFKLELLWNEEKFHYFEKFLFEYFEDNEDQAKEIINVMLFCKEYSVVDCFHPLIRPTEKSNPYEFNRIINLYKKYKTSDDQLSEMLKSSNIFCTMLNMMSNEIYPAFLKLIQNTFGQNKEQLLECINNMVIYNVIAIRERFILLRKLLLDFFENHETLKSEFIRKIIFFKYSGEIYPILQVLNKNHVDHIKEVYNFYINYKTSWEEIQNIFKRKSFLISIFNRVTEESYETVVNFIKEVFQNNLELLRELINDNCVNYDKMFNFRDMNKLKFFEKFVIDNQSNARECIKHILFGKDDNPLHKIINNKDLNELKLCIDMLRKYSDNLEEIQEYFIENEISSIFFVNYMSDEIYEILKKLLLEVFSKNLRNFKRFIKIADISEIIKNEEKFKLLENLIFEYFENNELLSKDLINSILYSNCDGNPIEINQDTPAYQFERIKNIYIKYKNSWAEFFDKISKLPDDTFESLREFMKEVFESNRDLIIKCFRKEYRQEVIGNKENYKSFRIFLIRYFESNNAAVNQFLKEFLHNEYEDSLHPLLSVIKENDFYKCSAATWVYSKYSDAFRNALLTTNLLFKILSSLSHNGYDSFVDLLKITFISDKSEIADCMNSDAELLNIWKIQNFDQFHKFLIDFFKDDKEQIRICVRKVLFYTYEASCHPLVKVLQQNDLTEFEKLTNHYIKYKESDEELQNILITILSYIFNNLTNDTFPYFLKFINLVFETNCQKLLKILEDFMSENEFECLSDDKKKFIEDFVMLSQRLT